MAQKKSTSNDIGADQNKKKRQHHRKSQFNQPQKRQLPIRVSAEKKVSPNSLRRVMIAIRNTYAGAPTGWPKFQDALRKSWLEFGTRYNITPAMITRRKLSLSAEEGKTPLLYWEIEAYANLLSSNSSVPVPSALLLLISRLTAHQKHMADHPDEDELSSAVDNFPQIKRGFLATFDFYEQNVRAEEEIDDDDIADLISAYVQAVRSERS